MNARSEAEQRIWDACFGTAFAMWSNHGLTEPKELKRAGDHARNMADAAVAELHRAKDPP